MERLGSKYETETQNKEERNHPRKLLTSYQHGNYARSDLCIYSSFEQPYLSFDSDTNSFFRSSQHLQPPPVEENKNNDSKLDIQAPGILVYFVPGNPGLIEFYHEFFLDLCESFDTLGGCEVISSGHLGHSLRYNSNSDLKFFTKPFQFWNNNYQNTTGEAQLLDQIAYHSQVIQNLLDHGIQKPSQTKLVIIGHSVGAYIATKILEKCPDRVMHVIGLFPTISHIGRSKNGRLLAPLFSPITLPLINMVQMIACIMVPKVLIYYLVLLLFRPNGSSTTRTHPKHGKKSTCSITKDSGRQQQKNKLSRETCLLLIDFVLNINSVSAVLKMARSEMQTIRDLDASLIRKFKRQISLVWTSPDGDEWVDEPAIEEILQVLKFPELSATSLYIKSNKKEEGLSVHSTVDQKYSNLEYSSSKDSPLLQDVPIWKRMQAGIPHAFCLNHNQIMVQECSQLIKNKMNNLRLQHQ